MVIEPRDFDSYKLSAATLAILEKWYWEVDVYHDTVRVFSSSNTDTNKDGLEHEPCWHYREAKAAADTSQSRYTLGGHPFDMVTVNIWSVE